MLSGTCLPDKYIYLSPLHVYLYLSVSRTLVVMQICFGASVCHNVRFITNTNEESHIP